MAGSISVPILSASYKSFGDQRSNQFLYQEMQATDVVQRTSATTAVAVGILQNQPNSGEVAVVMHVGISKAIAYGSITAGNLLGTSATGTADPKTPGSDTTEYINAQAIESVSSGEIVSVVISAIPHRAA